MLDVDDDDEIKKLDYLVSFALLLLSIFRWLHSAFASSPSWKAFPASLMRSLRLLRRASPRASARSTSGRFTHLRFSSTTTTTTTTTTPTATPPPPPSDGAFPLKSRSVLLTGDRALPHHANGSFAKTAASRANLRAAGWTDADFDKPVITVGMPWSNALPCNNHLRDLTDEVCAAVERQGGMPFVCGTPVISDGMTNGSEGMKYSLMSRELIADCIELMHEGYMADALITLSGCDKSVPAALMPIPRVDGIGITMYGGTAMPGQCEGCTNSKGGSGLDAKDVMEAIGSYSAGEMSEEDLEKYERHSLPGSGTCSAMFTANTMSSCIEGLGMSVPHSASRPALASAHDVVEESVAGKVQCIINQSH